MQELAEYKSESSELRNQDFTIRKLEERARELEAQLVEKVRGGHWVGLPAQCGSGWVGMRRRHPSTEQ